MRTLVTGGTGFIGAHVVGTLLEQGAQVRVLRRPTTDTSALDGRPVEWVDGDLDDAASLRRAVSGMSVVFHLAADYRLAVPRPRRMHQANVDGTVRLLRAAGEAGVPRIVYTSSAATVKCSQDRPANEQDFLAPGECRSTYQLTKVLAEGAVWDLIRQGAPITVVNPSTVIGPGDRRPTPTGRMIVDFLGGRMPGFLDAVMTWVCVEDVARGHWLAATRGETGQRYILAGETLSLDRFLQILAEVSGRRRPRLRIPYGVAYAAGMAGTAWSRVSGREPQATLDAVRMSATPMIYDGTKAARELGLPSTPIRVGVEKAVDWYQSDEFKRRRH